MTVLDWPAVDDGIQLPFGEPLGDDPMVLAAIHDCMPLDRTFTAWDADRFVGSTASGRPRLGVPGGQVDAAAVTAVAVARPYRRRGVLRSLMTAQLDAIAAAGEPLAILFASEATIYGRYGYGGAGPRAEVDIDLARSMFGDRGRAALAQFRESGGFLTEHTSHDVVAELTTVVNTLAAVRPGMMTRPDAQWRRMTLDSPAGRGRGHRAARRGGQGGRRNAGRFRPFRHPAGLDRAPGRGDRACAGTGSDDDTGRGRTVALSARH